MKEKLIIRNFGSIKSVELELSRFNVFIGEQGTGKSTVAKVLAVCRYFSYLIGNLDFIRFDNQFEEGLKNWGLDEGINSNTYISYSCKHYFLIVRVDTNKTFSHNNGSPLYISTDLKPISEEFYKLLGELKSITPPYKNSPYEIFPLESFIPTSFYNNEVNSILDNPFYIPTERGLQSIFSLGKDASSNMSDLLFRYFVEMDKVSRNFKNETEITPLNIQYKNIDGKGVIRRKEDDTFLNLHNAASGYQSTIPVVLLMEYYISIRKKAKTFIIEEPELNLFPSAQKELMQYLVDKTMNYGNTMLLTTHSPYVLTTLNNLLYAYKIGNDKKEKVNNIIAEKYWLNPEEISVYQLLGDGTCESIIDKEGLIKVKKIDIISSTINKDFNEIMNVELNINNEVLS